MRTTLAALALLALSAPLAAAPTIPLASGVEQAFQLPATSLTNSYYIDVGAADTQLKIELTADAGNTDVLLRYGTPFPDGNDAGGALDVNYLAEHAHYRSLGPTPSETIWIGKSNAQPVRAGRWFISVLNLSSTAATARIKATTLTGNLPQAQFQVVFDDPSDGCLTEPWNDAARGGQRRAAMVEAVRLLSQSYRSPVPLRIQACWTTSFEEGTLAASGPRYIARNVAGFSGNGPDISDRSPWLPRSYTWYPNAVIGKLAGAPYCSVYPTEPGCKATDFRIRFNLNVDGTGGTGFYYGLAPATTTADRQKADFVTVAMHEMSHGIGFSSQVQNDQDASDFGEKLIGYDDIYSSHIVDVRPDGTVVPFLDGTDASRRAAIQSFVQLRWAEPLTVASSLNRFRDSPPPNNLVRIYSTTDNEPGSTVSHIGNSHGQELMNPAVNNGVRSTGLSLPMLEAIGWTDAPAAVPANAAPRSTQYFDPARPGHGIDVQRVAGDTYFVVFYTYGAQGQPEWYIAIGRIVDGVFVPQANANGDTLVRYRYLPNGNPRQQADASVDGQIRIDFNQSTLAPACRDGVARDTSSPLAVMTWSIGTDRNRQWCMQSLIPTSARGNPDFTGAWYAGEADSGWGFSLLSFNGTGLFGLLYYPDANGDGRWAYAQANAATGQLTLKERRGYCRTCPIPAGIQAGQFDDVDAGTIAFTLTQPSALPSAGNLVNFSVTYRQAPGGTFARPNSPLILLSAPAN